MTLPLALRSSPSGPLIDIIDPDLESAGRVVYVNNRNTQDLDLQTGSAISPYSKLATAIFALAVTGGIIVIAGGDYSGEVLPNLGGVQFTFTNVDPHPNYTQGGIGFNNVTLPAISGSGGLNLVGCQLVSPVTLSNRLTLESCWVQSAIATTAIDGYDTRFISGSTIAISAGMTLTDCELDVASIATSAAVTVRLYDCTLVTSFSFVSAIASSTLRVDPRTCSAFDTILPTLTNTNLIVESVSVGSGRQIVNNTATGALGVVDISALQPGGAYVLQPTGNFNIDGFTAKQNGFWFDVIFDSASSVLYGTLNYDVGATLTSMRTPQSAAYTFLRNTTLRMRYQFNRWRVEVPGTGPAQALPILNNQAVPFVISASFAAGGGGAADDVAVLAANLLPFGVRVIDAWLDTITPVVGATGTLRSASGGVGTQLSGAMSAATANTTTRNSQGATQTLAANGTVFLRRSDSGFSGEVFMLVTRT